MSFICSNMTSSDIVCIWPCWAQFVCSLKLPQECFASRHYTGSCRGNRLQMKENKEDGAAQCVTPADQNCDTTIWCGRRFEVKHMQGNVNTLMDTKGCSLSLCIVGCI